MSTTFPELIATARDIEEVKVLLNAGADAVRIGHQQYGLRLPGDFELDDIKESVKYAHEQNKKVYIVANAIFHNEHLEKLPTYLNALSELNVDGVIVGEPSIFPILSELDKKLAIHWNPETLATNYDTLNYWHQKGANRAILSNELSLDAILEIKQHTNMPIEIQVHGMTCIFQSKRKLVTNYYNYISSKEMVDTGAIENKKLHLTQGEDTHYPVFEDCNGTHVMSNEDLCMVNHLDLIIENRIDAIRINGLMNTRDYNKQIVEVYRKAIDSCSRSVTEYRRMKDLLRNEVDKIQPKERVLDTGFYYKEQIY